MRRVTLLTSIVFISSLMTGASASAQTPGMFELRFDVSALTAQQQTELAPALTETKMFWESVIMGYQPGVTLDGIDITVDAMPIDGPNNILAQAGPGGFVTSQSGFTFLTDFLSRSSTGVVMIDTADFSTDLIVDVLKHEVGHALGFGSLFGDHGLVPRQGEYTGSAGLAAYQAEFDSTATFVPLQSTNAHLVENNPLSDEFGRAARDGLMTPVIANTTNANDPFSNYLSNTSLAIFRDLGYDTIETTFSVPDPVLGDVNQDGVVTFADIPPFIGLLQSGTYQQEADCNQDDVVGFADIPAFIAILIAQ